MNILRVKTSSSSCKGYFSLRIAFEAKTEDSSCCIDWLFAEKQVLTETRVYELYIYEVIQGEN